MIKILLAVGIVGVVVGFVSRRYLKKIKKEDSKPPYFKKLYLASMILGVMLGASSIVLCGAMVYPMPDKKGRMGRIAGIPFPVAYFDYRGSDYVGTISIVSTAGNALFWLYSTQNFVALYALLWRKYGKTKQKRAQNKSLHGTENPPASRSNSGP
jgi:hypothetical protein